MRIPATTIILAVAATAAAGGLWWSLQAPPPAPPPLGEPLFRFAASDLGAIEITRGESSTRLEPINTVWNIVSPIQDRLDSRAALGFFFGLNGLEIVRTLGPVENPETYGLGTRGARVRLFDPAGAPLHDLTLGHVTPWASGEDPTMYARWHNGPVPDHVLVVGGNLRMLLDQPLDALRSRQALHLPRPPLRVELRRGLATLELARETETAPWRIVKPIEERADQQAVAKFLKQLSDAETTELIPWAPADPALRDAPRLRVLTTTAAPAASSDSQHEENSNKPLTPEPAPPTTLPPPTPDLAFRVGPPIVEAAFLPYPGDPARTLARFSDRRHDLVLDAPPESWLPLDVNFFRARTLADFRPEDVESIALRDAVGSQRLIARDDDRWLVSTTSGDLIRADRMTIRDTIIALNNTKILEFPDDAPTDLARFGLDFPILQASLLLRGGTRRHLSFGEDDAGDIFARFDEHPSVYRVARTAPGLLPLSPAPWRARRLFDFTALDLRQIRLAEKGRPEIVLRYNPLENLWIALADGQNVSHELDPVAAASLAVSLESLTAHRWLPEANANAAAHFDDPLHDLLLTVVSPDDEGQDMPPIRTRLRLIRPNPQSPFLVGRLNDEPDHFLIRDSALDALRIELFPGD